MYCQMPWPAVAVLVCIVEIVESARVVGAENVPEIVQPVVLVKVVTSQAVDSVMLTVQLLAYTPVVQESTRDV